MKRTGQKLGVVLLGVLSGVAWIGLFVLCLRLLHSNITITVYVLVPLFLLIWAIIRYVRRKTLLTLLYAISFFASAVVLFIGLVAVIISALNHMT